MPVASSIAARALLVPALALVGCAGAGGEPGSRAVRIEQVHQRLEDGGVSDEARLIPAIRGSLGGLGGLHAAGRDHRGVALGAEIWFQEQPADGGAREIYLQAQIDVPTESRPLLGPQIHATVLLERSGGDVSLDDDVTLAAERAFAILDTRLALARGDVGVVRSLLAADDPELVLLALEWIRERAPAELVADVGALLTHPDERVAALAVECLGYSGDRGQVAAIIREARPRSRTHTLEVYRALARLRGPEALGYLRFAAANEDDSILQEEAERSLRLALTGIPAEPRATPGGPEPRLARGHRQ